jgi:7-cyano-7-deazaguanine synthase in queuosine biosynthesis
LKKREPIVVCGDAKLPLSISNREIIPLSLSGRECNVNLRISDVNRARLKNIPDILVDLLEIASYVMAADQAVTRGGGTIRSIEDKWRRNFAFYIPVRRPDFWNNEELKSALEETLWFLSDDEYIFHFSKYIRVPPIELYFEFPTEKEKETWPEEVLLFSGGLDSLAGAISESIVNGKKVALVSHRSSPKIDRRQVDLINELSKYTSKRQLLHIPVWMNKSKSIGREFTQRTRSFLFSSLATTIAQLYELKQIRFYENGVTSINLPIAEQLIGSTASRTTHPRVLDSFSKLFSIITESNFKVENPFIWKTKTDAINLIGDSGCSDLISLSVSCSRTMAGTRLHTHCGTCSQCIERRFGVLASRYASYDPPEMYRIDLLTGPRKKGEEITLVEYYIKLAFEINQMTDIDFFSKFGEANRVLRHLGTNTNQAASSIFKLYKRHAENVSLTIENGIKKYSKEIIEAKLPNSCVIILAVPDTYKQKIVTSEFADKPTFRKNGNLWLLAYDGKTVFMKDYKGLTLIAYLLKRSHEEVPLRDLHLEAEKQYQAATKIDKYQLEEQKLESFSSELTIELTDKKTIDEVKERLLEVEVELIEANQNNDIGNIEKLENEKQQLTSYLASSIGITGRPRQFGNKYKRMNDRISKSILRAIEKVKEVHPLLGFHLSNSIKVGLSYKYTPEKPLDWQL